MKVEALMIVLASLDLCYCSASREVGQSGHHPWDERQDGLPNESIITKGKQRYSEEFQEALTIQRTENIINKDTATNGLMMKGTKTSRFGARERTFQDEVITSHFQHEIFKSDLIDMKDAQVRSQLRLTGELRQRKRRNIDSLPDIKNCTSSLVSCNGRCRNEQDAGGMQNLRCSCDPYCDYFKDCCADYVQYCLGQQRSSMKVPAEQWTCRSGIWMIASCPHSWTNQDINQSCISTRSMTADNYRDALPVVTADNKTYANRFCALCHGQSMKTISDLVEKIEFECLVTPPRQATKQQRMIFLFEHCKHSLKLKKDQSKRNCFKPVAKCNLTSPEEIRIKCSNKRYGLVYDAYTKTMFKNIYCAICNNATLVSCGPFSRHKKINKSTPSTTAVPFSIIMDIGGETSQPPKLSENLSCPRGNVYDIYLETCRRGQKLVPFASSMKIYSITMWMNTKTNHTAVPNISLFNDVDFSRSLASALRFNFTKILKFSIEPIDHSDGLIKVEFQIDLTGHMNNQTGTSRPTPISPVFSPSIPFQLMIDNATFIVIKVTSKPLTCVQIDTYSNHEYQVIPATEASVYINTTGEVLGVRDYFPTNLTIIKGKQVPVGQIVVCRQMPSVNCSGIYIFLQKHEYTIFPNRSVLYKASGRLYEHGTYTWKNGTIMICTNFTESYQQRSQPVSGDDHKALTILTYIGFCISVACLLFVLVTYSIFADLRTIPGINLMNLCSALFVAQILWLVGSGLTFTHLGCMVIAIILHYSFLVAFGWMSIIALNTWRAFSGQANTRNYRTEKGQKRKRIARTMAVGWLPLIMYVSICVALDRSGTVAFGYGGEKGCWINNPQANLLFFAAPVGLSIVWNTVFFVLTIKEIKKAIDQSQMAASQHRARQDSTVYARIAVLMGFTWVFGFVAPFTSYYLMYPFVVLNTLQGLYIAVAFGFTRRVRTLYRNIGTFWNGSTSSNRHNRSIEGTNKTKV